jgi:hypothetical protein
MALRGPKKECQKHHKRDQQEKSITKSITKRNTQEEDWDERD